MQKLSNRFSAQQLLVGAYFLATFLSVILLMLPLSLKEGVTLSFIDALFIATSAVSVTGLVTVNPVDTFSVFGTFVLIFACQVGGIGIMTLGTFLWILLGKNIGLSYRMLIMTDQNRNNLSGLVQLMKLVIGMAIFFEAIGTVTLGFYFWGAGYYATWYEAFYYALFHCVSSYTNAGIDIFGNSMLGFSHDYFVQGITMLLIMLGAIGFPVLVEAYEYFVKKCRPFRFSLYTKLTTLTFFFLIVVGFISILAIENNQAFIGMSWHEKVFYALFNSVTTRSCGLVTMNMTDFSTPTQFLMSIFMFIGASPSSVGGGIRTTTLAIMIFTVIAYARGRQEVQLFGRSLYQTDIIKSFVVFTVSSITVCTSIIILLILEHDRFSVMEVLFEVCSAFGTTGLSLGITSNLSTVSQCIIVLLMFMGRIGVPVLLFVFKNKQQSRIRYPGERVMIG
ncbi:TrkH family potassium uptake protein [Aneurinibacillus uraniidurans]|uniref:TrkH family potassium uptake protein n=1 Tax=Aneurinibacillus uraniidurans TaxID=2966586 RepID=UPI0023496A0B|nr:potassium transporter TrkG [Aneurinibacillus sp. B1]WCN37945.1 potassium transporter TrkG [Aneurinibacillus sp. B1]